MKKFKRGFTLIELLVVIAIIGILTSVVLSSMNTARDKSANANIKANLQGARQQVEIFYDTNNTFVGICTEPNMLLIFDSAATAAGVLPAAIECNSDAVSWAIQAPLKIPDANGDTYWCIDENASPKGELAPLGASLVCA